MLLPHYMQVTGQLQYITQCACRDLMIEVKGAGRVHYETEVAHIAVHLPCCCMIIKGECPRFYAQSLFLGL